MIFFGEFKKKVQWKLSSEKMCSSLGSSLGSSGSMSIKQCVYQTPMDSQIFSHHNLCQKPSQKLSAIVQASTAIFKHLKLF